MRRWILACGATFLLAGCSSVYQTQMDKGDKAMSAKKYEDAIQAYGLAMKEKPQDNDAKIKFVGAKSDYFDDLKQQSKTAEGKQKYDEAKADLEKAVGLFPNRKKELTKDMQRLNDKIQTQKEVAAYETWVTASTKNYQDMIQMWRSEMTAASIGQQTKEQVAQMVMTFLQKADDSVKNIENESVGLDPDLATLHKTYYDQGSDVYDAARDLLLEFNKPDIKVSDIVSDGKQVEDKVKQQLNYPNTIEQYKHDNGL